MRPIVLPPNGVARFYRGGPAIAALRGGEPAGERVPEEWIGSVTEAFGEPGVGLSRLPGGALLRDAIAADPEAWLGAEHTARLGADPALLVKLLDAGERLPVHAHPDGPFAREHLGTRFGKTEAWIVVGGEGDVGLGWREDVEEAVLRDWVARQDVEAMLAALHRVPVRVGDALFVPAGTAHAIGEGLLIAELQEPSDMSVMLEWEGHGIAGEAEATLGLGWGTALASVSRRAGDPGALAGPPRDGAVSRALPEAADPFFAADWLDPAAGAVELAPGFAVLVVLEGAGILESEDAPVELSGGDALLVPFAAGVTRLTGDARALRCRPPDPDAPAPASR
jgi:mannose-6-phosphate isomerase